jgi:hypothetical protein
MERRDVLRALGAAGALALLPTEAAAAWARVSSGFHPTAGLTEAQLALVNAVADTLIPRTDTPGAVDVNVGAFVDLIVAENYNDADRTAFMTNLDVIDASSMAASGANFTGLSPAARGSAIEQIESVTDRRAEPQRTYWRLKGLIVHGYFTAETVMKDVLKVQVLPGAFNGNAPHNPAGVPPRSGAENGPARSAAEHSHA